MAAISETIFSDAFCEWQKLYFDWNLDNGMAPNRRQAVIWTNADLVHWRIYAALGGDELSAM